MTGSPELEKIMSIYKNEQRDGRHFWSWICGLFGQRCRSYVKELVLADTIIIYCVHRRGHSGKHEGGEYKWGYGENWLEGN